MVTYKSPVLPLETASPIPVIFIVSPLRIPAGIFIFISSLALSTPAPLQVTHFSLGICPLPLQTEQVCSDCIAPKIVLFTSLTLPLPLHFLQVSILVPGFAPEPTQVLHLEILVMTTFFSTPKIDSSKLISISIAISLLLFFLCLLKGEEKPH